MKNRIVNVVVALIAVITAFITFPSIVKRMDVKSIPLPKELRTLTSFSDAPSFKEISPRVFQYKDGTKEPYLRLSFPSGHYEDLQLLLKIRATDKILAGIFPRGATGLPKLTDPIKIANGVATLNFSHVSEPATEFNTGTTYIGVSFNMGTIKVNDVVEIVELKFHYGL